MDNDTIDINKIVSDLVLETGKAVLSSLGDFGKQQYKKALTAFQLCFRTYLKHGYDRYSITKTILYRDKPVLLKRFYVATNVTVGKRVIATTDIDTLLDDSKRQVFVGTAGCGKSTFLKYLFTRLVETKSFGVPVMLELRHLNTEPDTLPLDFLFNSLQEMSRNFDKEQFERSMQSGKMVLLFDGFDEIDLSLRPKVAKTILSVSSKYPRAPILVASRPDDVFDSWQEFTKYRMQPLTKAQAIELISKLDYDLDVKSRFLDEMQKGLYKRHEDFLSNPLLLTMMLLTYEQIAEIPSKMHIFYNQAFETLFNKHDALKSLYKRKTYTEMPVDDFKRVLSAFSMTSYTKRIVTFSRANIDQFLDSARKLTSLEYTNDDFLNDLLESVCILYRDGIYYTYTHRSFQEYFAAHFLCYFNSPKRKQLLEKLVTSALRDNVLRLLFEMNPEAVEQDLFMPMLRNMTTQIQNVKGGVYKYIRILDKWYDGLSNIHGDQIGYRMSDGKPISYLVIFIYSMYPELREEFAVKHETDSEPYKELVRKAFSTSQNRFIPFMPISKEKHNMFLELGCKEYVKHRLTFAKSFLAYLEKKYRNRASDIDSLLFK